MGLGMTFSGPICIAANKQLQPKQKQGMSSSSQHRERRGGGALQPRPHTGEWITYRE